jgi:hypothetical protein
MEAQVVGEKILEVDKRCIIVKTFFVMHGVENTGIAVLNLALFYLSSNFHKMKLPTVSIKSCT